MNKSDDIAARLTIRLAGVLQEIQSSWSSRVNAYFTKLESLVEGKWLDTEDIMGIISESKLAAKEALDGLGNDLSSEILHESSGLFSRFEDERLSLAGKISVLEKEIEQILGADDESLSRQNRRLRQALLMIKEFVILKSIQGMETTCYRDLSESTGIKKGKLRKPVKWLHEQGFIAINKKTRPYQITFLHAPWKSLHAPQSQAQVDVVKGDIPLDTLQH